MEGPEGYIVLVIYEEKVRLTEGWITPVTRACGKRTEGITEFEPNLGYRVSPQDNLSWSETLPQIPSESGTTEMAQLELCNPRDLNSTPKTYIKMGGENQRYIVVF